MEIVWVLGAVLFGVIEALTTALVSIWFTFGCITAYIASKFNTSVPTQFIVFTVVSLMSFLVCWKFFMSKRYVTIKPTNIDRLIGRDVVVTTNINTLDGTGEIKVDGTYWSAREVDNQNVEKDSVVTVVKIEGNKLYVKKKELEE